MKPSPVIKTPPPGPDFFSPDVARARRFYLDLSPPRRQRLTVVCGGLEHCTPDYSIHRDSFPFYSLEYVARGCGRLQLAGRRHELHPGRIFSYGPGIPHDITGDPKDTLVKYFVNFTGPAAAELLQKSRMAAGKAAQMYPSDTLAPLFDELISSGLRGGRDGTKLCLKLLECIALKISTARAPLVKTETSAFVTYQNCRAYIEKTFLSCEHWNRPPPNVMPAFHTFAGCSAATTTKALINICWKLKMRHAAERLQQPNALVKQVAEAAGYADPFHFSRVFRSVLGLSPANFKSLR